MFLWNVVGALVFSSGIRDGRLVIAPESATGVLSRLAEGATGCLGLVVGRVRMKSSKGAVFAVSVRSSPLTWRSCGRGWRAEGARLALSRLGPHCFGPLPGS